MKEINIAKTILLKRKEKKISKQFGEHHVIDGTLYFWISRAKWSRKNHDYEDDFRVIKTHIR